MTTTKQIELFSDFSTSNHDGKLILTGNLKKADVDGLKIQNFYVKKSNRNLVKFNLRRKPNTFRQFANLVQLPYNNRKPANPLPVWSPAGVNQVNFKYKDFKTRCKVKTTFF